MWAKCSATKGSIELAGAATRLIATNSVFFNIGARSSATVFRVSLDMPSQHSIRVGALLSDIQVRTCVTLIQTL
jgi:hypothetical protein